MASLDDLKTMLGLAIDDTSQDSVLALILKNTDLQLRFKLALGVGEQVPNELAYIPIEVAVRRYNRLKTRAWRHTLRKAKALRLTAMILMITRLILTIGANVIVMAY